MKQRTPNFAVQRAAERLIGSQFRPYGRDRTGVDCVGVLAYVCTQLGFPYKESRAYDCYDYTGDRMFGLLVDHLPLREVETEQPVAGDVLLFGLGKEKQASHVGVKTSRGFVHVLNNKRGVVHTGFDSLWNRRLIAVFEWV